MARAPRKAAAAAVDKLQTPPAGTPSPYSQIGVTALKVSSGYVFEEFLVDLQGDQGRRKFVEMSENDATVGALLAAFTLILRSVKWEARPAKDVPVSEAEDQAEFAQSLIEDMSHTWAEFMSEVLSMFTFGWAYHEIVWKKRQGPTQRDGGKRSKYDDGLIGIRKLAPRAQESLERWEMQSDGGITGMWQYPPYDMVSGVPLSAYANVFIPIQKSLLFRTTVRKNNPEGVSLLRKAYRAWFFLKRIQEIEAIGIERELAGLPVVRIPASYLTSTNPLDIAVKQAYEKVARDLKFNEQGALVIPSDPWRDQDGKYSTNMRVSIELLTTGGTRSIDTTKVKTDYQRDIARSVLADFMMLGSDKGAYNLAESKQSLFMKALEAVLQMVAEPINRFLIPRTFDLNGIDPQLQPEFVPGSIVPTDLVELGTFLKDVSQSGEMLFPDGPLSDWLREKGGLPPRDPSLAQRVEDQADIDAEMAERGLEGAALGNEGQQIGNEGAQLGNEATAREMEAEEDGRPFDKARRRTRRGSSDFDESKHPRDDDGRWATSSGGGDMNDAERRALSKYKENSSALNGYLRGDRDPSVGDDPDTRKALDALFARSTTTETETVYRASNYVDYESMMDKRGSFADAAYVSTSRSESVAREFVSPDEAHPTLLRIEVPKGSSAVVHPNDYQQEVTLPRGTKFQITGIDRSGKTTIISLRATTKRPKAE